MGGLGGAGRLTGVLWALEAETLGTLRWSSLEALPKREEEILAEIHNWHIYRAARPSSFVVLRTEPEAF